MTKPTIAIDFDGVIHRYSKGWSDGSIYDEPMPGCREALLSLSDKYQIIIFSTRNYDRVIKGEHQKNQIKEMADWLNEYLIPYDRIHTKPNKPVCKLFVDDNAYRFEGDWQRCLKDVESLLSGEKQNGA